jgi:hypothetical protein
VNFLNPENNFRLIIIYKAYQGVLTIVVSECFAIGLFLKILSALPIKTNKQAHRHTCALHTADMVAV